MEYLKVRFEDFLGYGIPIPFIRNSIDKTTISNEKYMEF